MNAADEIYLTRIVQQMPAGAGQSLLKQIVAAARSSETPSLAARAHAALARADPVWSRSLLTDPDGVVRINAAYAQAERGDPSVLSMVLTASKEQGKCEFFFFFKESCNPYATDALAILELMQMRLQPPRQLVTDAESMRGLSQPILSSLQLVARSGDLTAARRLLAALHPSSRREDREALEEASRSLGRTSLRMLIRALPSGPGAEQKAMFSGLAEGLKWRALESSDRIEFCAMAMDEARQDLVAAWKAAGQRCDAGQ